MALNRRSKTASVPEGAEPALQKEIREREAVVKALFFGGDAEVPESKQLAEGKDPFSNVDGGIIQPPINLDLWARMMELNSRLGRCVRTYARNTVGLGWEVVPTIPVNDQTPPDVKAKVAAQKAQVEALLKRPNKRMPFVTLFTVVKMDEEAMGNGYMEVARNPAGKINGLFHVSAVTVRLRKNGLGFVQVRGNQKKFFKEFGDKRIIDAETGKVLVREDGTKTEAGNKFSGLIPPKNRASEILHFLLYSPRSSFYGLPRYMASSPAVSGNRLAANRNVAFFENDATPRLIITVSGGRIAPESVQMLERFVRGKGKNGPAGAHRIAVLQVEERQVGIGNKPNRTAINVVPVTVGTTEDASFQAYRTANDEEVRETFGISQVYFASENVNKSCLTGDTLVPLLDGRTLSMADLVGEYGAGGDFWVYSSDKQGRVVPGRASHPRLTKKQVEIWEVLLDNGDTVRGTPDHLFMLIDGTYKEIGQLRHGDRLKPLYRAVRPIGYGKRPYWWYSTYGMRKQEPVHRMVGRFLCGGPIPVRHEVHHTQDSLDNRPEILRVLSPSEHATEDCRIRWAGKSPEERRNAVIEMLRARRKSLTFEAIVSEAAKALNLADLTRRLDVDRVTLFARVEERGVDRKDFMRQFFPVKRMPVRRTDITLDKLLVAAPDCRSIHDLAARLDCSTGLIKAVLRRAGKTWGWLKSEYLKANVGGGTNHKVMRVRKVGVADVYDITVEEHHNFALKAGVFVHNSAFASMDVTENQEFEPDRTEKEFLLNSCIVADLLGTEEPLVKIHLKRPMLTDPMDQARIHQIYATLGALTPNELREALGKEQFPSSYTFANKPLQVALTELSLGAAVAIRSLSAPPSAVPVPPAAPVAPGAAPAPTANPASTVVAPPATGVPLGKEIDVILDLIGDTRRFALSQVLSIGQEHGSNGPPKPEKKVGGRA